MRILLTTRGSAGHLLPLVPVARACMAAGHDVLVAAQGARRGNVERAGLPFAPVGDPPAEEWMPLMADFAEMDFDAANAAMIGRFFGGIDTRASLPDLMGIVDRWRPDVIVRETWEFASTVAAEARGLPIARVGLGLRSLEDLTVDLAAPAVGQVRAAAGLPPDPAGDRLRAGPYITAMPREIDDAAGTDGPTVHRYGTRPPDPPPPPPDGIATDGDPLVYVTFGSVAADAHLPYFPALYRAAVEALAPLPARVLVTVGEGGDLQALRPLPANVRVERWVPQDAILPRAAAVVCHGGYGSTLGALAHGVPLVVLPLFSADQWANGEAVARAGAGIGLTAERRTRPVLALPSPETLGGLAEALRRVLEDPAYGETARRVAAAIRALPPVEGVVGPLSRLAAAEPEAIRPRTRPGGSAPPSERA